LTSNRFSVKKTSVQSSSVILDGEEHRHLSKVARIKPQQKVWLFDEEGRNYLARVEVIEKDRTRLVILEKEEVKEPSLRITLGQALIKAKKMNSIIQKATELGVTAIIPVIAARTIVKIEEKEEKKLERWKKIIRESAKQSHVSFLPSIMYPVKLEKLIKEQNEEKKLLLSENQGKLLRDILIPGLRKEGPPSSVLLLVGPEGGWTGEEERFILDHGFEAVSLGSQILRTETAALSSLAMIAHFWNS
jgi:16S rRNA (uracil1498-N3)-methyltransferase